MFRVTWRPSDQEGRRQPVNVQKDKVEASALLREADAGICVRGSLRGRPPLASAGGMPVGCGRAPHGGAASGWRQPLPRGARQKSCSQSLV